MGIEKAKVLADFGKSHEDMIDLVKQYQVEIENLTESRDAVKAMYDELLEKHEKAKAAINVLMEKL